MTDPTDVARSSPARILHDLNSAEAGLYGVKVAGLVDAIAHGATVLPGLALAPAFVNELASSASPATLLMPFTEVIEQLKGATPKGSLVARSSSRFEGSGLASFSGLFDTRIGLQSHSDVVAAVGAIARGARHSSLLPYFERFAIDENGEHMGVLLQPQIACRYAGVIHPDRGGFLVEFTSDDAAKAIAGNVPYSSIRITPAGLIRERVMPRDADIDFALFERAIERRAPLWTHVQQCGALVEFLFVDGEIIVTQLTKLLKEAAPKGLDARSHRHRFANKTEAMRFFLENELFGKECIILDKGWSIRDVMLAASKILEGGPYLTVRIANGAEIGLPRTFCSTSEEAVAFVEAEAEPQHDLILHGYIDVERSVEMLIDSDGYLLEHVPGMWESPNRSQPDVIRVERGKETRFRYRADRFVSLDPKTPDRPALHRPLSKAEIERLSNCGANIWRTITQAMPDQLPVNVHLVASASFDEVHALNIRPGFTAGATFAYFGEARLVEQLADLADWQPEQVVRLALTTSRGEERSLIPIAETLSRALHPVIIEFGLLSHPAMVLRDYGCRLVPSYLVQSRTPLVDHDVSYLSHDFGLDPVSRILSEPAVLSSRIYHLVLDREPITHDHFLSLNRAASISLAEGGCLEEVERLYRCVSEDGSALFYERGRAPVCTSMFTAPREHFHFLRGLNTARITERLRALVGGSQHQTLDAAYRHVPPNGTYVVYGSMLLGFYVSQCANAPKRLLRLASAA